VATHAQRPVGPAQQAKAQQPEKAPGHALAQGELPPHLERDLEALITRLSRTLGKCKGRWLYYDADGQVVGAVVRFDPPDGDKKIRPLRLKDGHWEVGGIPEPRPLFGLRELLKADPTQRVWVTEGEKCAVKLQSLGLVAVTSASGASAAKQTDWTPLRGRHVIIAPDNDDPGERYAQEVAELAHAAGAASVRIVRLAEHAPALPHKGDIANIIEDPEWCGIGLGDAAELSDLAALLNELADKAPLWTPPPQPEPGPIVTCLADIEPREVTWLWPGRFPRGRMSLLVGRPGEGKSFLTLDMAARVSTGTPWPDGPPCERGHVLLLTAEDDPADTIRPRLEAHVADLTRVHVLAGVRRQDESGPYERLISLADIDAIEEAIKKLPDCRLLIVDPIGSFLGGRTDAHRDNEVRAVLTPLVGLAAKHGVAVVVVAHRRKSGGDYADDLALGSRAFTGLARTVWHLSRDPDNKARRLLLPGKNNLGPEGTGLAFTIAGDPPRLMWERDPIEWSADEGLAREEARRRPGPDAEAEVAAEAWLRAALAQGRVASKELVDEWTNGHGGSRRTLFRAKSKLGVTATREGRRWYWELSAPADTPTPWRA
jgi:5S rRNA maturation endonuclease (ribonuclease M5)